jgi:hypothetical protein
MTLHLLQPTELQDTELAKIDRGCIRCPLSRWAHFVAFWRKADILVALRNEHPQAGGNE